MLKREGEIIEQASILFMIPVDELQAQHFLTLKAMLSYCFAKKPELLCKPMSREQVVAAYHCFLDRAPESEQAISESMRARLYDRIADICMSEEFCNQNGYINCRNLLFTANTKKSIPPVLLHDDGSPVENTYKAMSTTWCTWNSKIFAKYIADERKKIILDLPAPSIPSVEHLISKVCTQNDIESGWSRYWINQLQQNFAYHRKHWEQSFVLQVLFDHDMLKNGKRGLGLACGKEPLASYLASKGCAITGGDCPEGGQWVNSSEYTESIEDLYHPSIIDRTTFEKNFTLCYTDMNNLSEDHFGKYDFCWSVCAVEHLGSIEAGLAFLKNSLRLLKPGGISVHTTEFNYLDTPQTIDNCESVLFTREHIELLAYQIANLGGELIGPDFNPGNDILDKYIDFPPYSGQILGGINMECPLSDIPHIKMNVFGFPATCFGIVMRKNIPETN